MATFYFDLDSLSETLVSPLLCGGCWEAGSRDPSLHPASSAGPHFSPLLPLRTPEARTSTLTRPPIHPSIHPPAPQRGRGARPKAVPAGLVASDTKTRLFPSSASHVCWCGFGVLLPCSPGVPPPRPQKRGSRIQQESGLGAGRKSRTTSFCPPRSPLLTPPG